MPHHTTLQLLTAKWLFFFASTFCLSVCDFIQATEHLNKICIDRFTGSARKDDKYTHCRHTCTFMPALAAQQLLHNTVHIPAVAAQQRQQHVVITEPHVVQGVELCVEAVQVLHGLPLAQHRRCLWLWW